MLGQHQNHYKWGWGCQLHQSLQVQGFGLGCTILLHHRLSKVGFTDYLKWVSRLGCTILLHHRLSKVGFTDYLKWVSQSNAAAPITTSAGFWFGLHNHYKCSVFTWTLLSHDIDVRYLGECFGERLKHIWAVEATVKVDVELGSEVGQMAQLCVCVCGYKEGIMQENC